MWAENDLNESSWTNKPSQHFSPGNNIQNRTCIFTLSFILSVWNSHYISAWHSSVFSTNNEFHLLVEEDDLKISQSSPFKYIVFHTGIQSVSQVRSVTSILTALGGRNTVHPTTQKCKLSLSTALWDSAQVLRAAWVCFLVGLWSHSHHVNLNSVFYICRSPSHACTCLTIFF